MSRNFRLWEDGHIVSLLAPAADSAGRTSSYITLKNVHKAYVVCYVTQGNSTPVEWSINQAVDASGSQHKVLSQNVPIVALEDDSVTDLFTVESDAKNYTNGAGTKNKIVIFEIDPIKCMDLNNLTYGSFDHISVTTGASSASNITSALLVMMPLRNAQIPAQSTFGV